MTKQQRDELRRRVKGIDAMSCYPLLPEEFNALLDLADEADRLRDQVETVLDWLKRPSGVTEYDWERWEREARDLLARPATGEVGE